MDRIDPAKEPEQFTVQELLPGRGFYTETDDVGVRRACLIGRMAVEAMGYDYVEETNQKYDNILSFASALGMHLSYALGLMDGWEGGPVYTERLPVGSTFRTHPYYPLGKTDGAAAWDACVTAGLCGDNEPAELC